MFAHLPTIELPHWSELASRLIDVLERHLVMLLAAALLVSSALLAATIDLKRNIMGGGLRVVTPIDVEVVGVDPFYETKKLAPAEELPPQF